MRCEEVGAMKAKRKMVAIVVALGLLVSACAATPALAWDGGLGGQIGVGDRAPERLQNLPHGPGTDEVRRHRDSTP
jgi:hypothetical protein